MDVNQYTFDAAFNNGHCRHPDDAARICRVAAGMGIRMTLWQAEELWESHSAAVCAGWLNLRDDQEIQDVIRSFIDARLTP
jgi:hypothetical protein